MNCSRLVRLPAAFLLASLTAMADDNLALHQPYTMQPTPNYRYLDWPMCTDDGDKTDLTDGRRATFRGGYLWWCREAIGVLPTAEQKIFRVVIDLGQVRPIGRVLLSTSPRCPEAGVTLNAFALALSEDGRRYRVTDQLTPLQPLAPDAEREQPRQGLEVNLHGHGVAARYVCVAAIPHSWITLDEIEVYPAAPAAAARPPLFECDYDELPYKLSLPGRRLALDQPLFGELFAALLAETSHPEQKYFLSQLHQLQAAHQRALHDNAAACEQVLAQLPPFAAEWQRSRLKRQPDLLAWPANPYVTPPVFTVPREPVADQTLHLLRNQKGLAAVNLCWKGPQPARLTVTLRGPAGATLRRAWRTESITTSGAARIADALVLEKDNPLTLTPGVVEQLLLVIPPNSAVAAYTLQLQADGDPRPVTHTIRVRCERVALPDKFDTVNGGWFYLDWDTRLIPAAAQAQYLRESHVNAATFTWAACARPVFNDRGEVVKPAAPTALVATAQLYAPFCRYYYLGLNPNWLQWETGQPPADPAIVAKAWAESIRQTIELLRPLGIRPDQFLLAPADEDSRGEKWLPFRRALDQLPAPRPKLFCTMGGLPDKTDPERDRFIEAVDIFVIGHTPWHRPGGDPAGLLPRMRAAGKEVWGYDCVSTRITAPHHYRLYPWEMLAAGSRGNWWWPHDGVDQPLWNTSHGYALYYGQRGAPAELKITEDLVPSRRMEAWRAGIEDRWLIEQIRARARRQRDHVARAFADEQLAQALADPTNADRPHETNQWLVRMLGRLVNR